jgi:hypothetical protein
VPVMAAAAVVAPVITPKMKRASRRRS